MVSNEFYLDDGFVVVDLLIDDFLLEIGLLACFDRLRRFGIFGLDLFF